MIVAKIIPLYTWPRLKQRGSSVSFALSYDYKHTRKRKSYDSFKLRHVSDEQQTSSVHAQPVSGCDINVFLNENLF